MSSTHPSNRDIGVTRNFQVTRKGFLNGKKGVLQEGGSRSGKTWAICQFIVWFIITFTGKVITVGRDHRVTLKRTLWQDFKQVLLQFGIYEDCKINLTDFELTFNGNLVRFIGVNDDPMKVHGLTQDIFWLNEAMNIHKDVFDQMEQRTSSFWICDYNPSRSESWLYDMADFDNDVAFHKSTVLDNPFVPSKAKAKILSYEPTPENIARKTADEFKWKVYGKGERGADEDVIFPNWSIYEDKKESYDFKFYGGDFGFTDPTTVVEIVIDGRNIYLKEVLFESDLGIDDIANRLKDAGDGKWEDAIAFDSAEPRSIRDLRERDIPALPAAKGANSVIYGIQAIKRYEIFIHRNSKNLILEFKNFKWKKDKAGAYVYTSKGHQVPDDSRDSKGLKYDHGIAAVRYGLTKFTTIVTDELD